ncbi:hypothetical protein NE237_033109 [Protea cynaroides]|uniref:CRIB domain-containing protein n=1 Tax=Protea cynaroides TaxID=273540 RepID=A0A9Q0R468_9MAGN|nr:hypothetical protein NE237_033109 [Protea cynaroides]
MSTKMKGIYKGFKCISHLFVVKEQREMEIGYPTDVKHVAHIGWDDQSANPPGWMNEFKSPSDFSAMSLGSLGGESDPSFVPISSWSSLDFDQSMARQPHSSELSNDAGQPKDLPKAPKKHKRKKTKSTSASSTSSLLSRSSRAAQPKSSFVSTVAATVAEI